MDKGASAETVTPRPGRDGSPNGPPQDRPDTRPSRRGDGLAAQVAAVETARTRLGEDLDQLSVQMRAQMGIAMQRMMWKAAATGAAVLAGLIARKGMTLAWRAVTDREPPEDPESPATNWVDALGWTAATGVAVAVARLVAARGAAAGWERTTGAPPPGAGGR